MKPRLLFVDDEPNIRLTLPVILERHGFDVTAVATVPEALALISAEKYDILLADLNLGEVGDGFTVVSAMRRTQPQAVNFILTGYPAFESALRAIREQVDDFFTKPADLEKLVAALHRSLQQSSTRELVTTKRLPQIIQENKEGIIQEWLTLVEENPEVAAVPLSRQERLNHLPEVLDELLRARTPNNGQTSIKALNAAELHGVRRREQGYSIPMVLEEGRILHNVISDFMRRNLLVVDISYLIPDLTEVNDRIHHLVQEAVKAYLRLSLETPTAA